uniref:Uncharacterized protein n=1 Tax=Lotharella globosa TaxID=91324 RepID=A0A7S3ZBG7_9EUKA|mmetsp:Transcript_24992/g.48891  ORF Transcript_24992/g.48891 Transcript_24992/m.48891 type:complete len:364 (+) Transcript_24992:51-1142(+)|eukprot:CAMPEP_0167802436 /NCGR_PEP_ID=MMETSP0111_2-20121227/19132_1 /TAXON_ID=91324 /ORGANISM="Lotharella globosa, Strain CCCM811" /LENGTH=363 /DNA_ID=CAMNT_0007698499 /DNA_START=36 /DNA_END=1127 /DNA_ORIENTATION=+
MLLTDIQIYYPYVCPYRLVNIGYTLEDDGKICVVYFNESKKLNRWTRNCICEMSLVLEHLRRKDSIKCVIWSGVGRGFSSGAAFETNPRFACPLSVRNAYQAKGLMGDKDDLALKNLTLSFLRFNKPSIAAVNGVCVGGAVNFAWFFHDIVIASHNANFMYPFSSIGITPELGSSLFLPKTVGLSWSKKMFLLGQWTSADEAMRLGLVNYVVPPETLINKSLEIARRLIDRSQTSIKLTKQLVIESMGGWSRIEEVLDRENAIIRTAMKSPDTKARIAAFQSKHEANKKNKKNKSKKKSKKKKNVTARVAKAKASGSFPSSKKRVQTSGAVVSVSEEEEHGATSSASDGRKQPQIIVPRRSRL